MGTARSAVDPIGAEPLQDDNMKKGRFKNLPFFMDTLALLRKAAV